ncbi:MAG: integrase arm-type DNA-binding domain-containing protein [Rhodospirillales bacterium]|nr:integrase arm-type DNA-binding domain-containing protein [Rhodospirillales bacterium]
MSETTRFTKTTVARLACPPDRAEAFYWAEEPHGFGLRCLASGARRYIVQYRTKAGAQRRVSLGDPKDVKLDAAREKARDILAQVRLGGDPQGEQQAARKQAREAVRVGELIESYLAVAKKRMRPRAYAETERHLRGTAKVKHAKPLHGRIAAEVNRREIAKLLAAIAERSGGVTANRVRSSLSAMWTWAVMAGLQDANPVALTAKPAAETSRERVLTDAELAAIWQATSGGDDHDRIVRLLMLTGCRRDEVGRMRWSELEGDLWTLPGARAKNGLPHELPLPALAVAQLPPRRTIRAKDMQAADRPRDAVFGKLETGFSGWSRCKERLDERLAKNRQDAFIKQHGREPRDDEAKVIPWTLHDLRRTFVTRLNDLGLAEPHVIEALVNHHSGGAKRGVAGIYNRSAYRDQKRTALARWADHAAALVGHSMANVETMRRG